MTDVPKLVDPAAPAGIAAPHHRAAGLHGPHDGMRSVLPGARLLPKPDIVGGHEMPVRPGQDIVPGQGGEYVLVTDQVAGTSIGVALPLDGQGSRFCARVEGGLDGDKLPDERKVPAKRDKLPERHQVALGVVVFQIGPPDGIDMEHRIVPLPIRVIGAPFTGHIACQDGQSQLGGQSVHPLPHGKVALEGQRCGRFRPEQQLRTEVTGIGTEVLQRVQVLPHQLRIPFRHDRRVGLDEPEPRTLNASMAPRARTVQPESDGPKQQSQGKVEFRRQAFKPAGTPVPPEIVQVKGQAEIECDQDKGYPESPRDGGNLQKQRPLPLAGGKGHPG